jgi:hypothetical protein
MRLDPLTFWAVRVATSPTAFTAGLRNTASASETLWTSPSKPSLELPFAGGADDVLPPNHGTVAFWAVAITPHFVRPSSLAVRTVESELDRRHAFSDDIVPYTRSARPSPRLRRCCAGHAGRGLRIRVPGHALRNIYTVAIG